MDKREGKIIYSPTDLVKFIESPYASWLDHFCLENPEYKENKVSSKMRDELFNLGNLLEISYYKKLESQHFKKMSKTDKVKLVLNSGYNYVAQVPLKKGEFEGYADLLVREKGKSKLGNYYYTVKDIKRASVPKAKFIVQICCYLEMLEEIQGVLPEESAIILGMFNEEKFRVRDYYDYYLNIKELFLDFHRKFDSELKPTPKLGESFGDWEDEAIKYLEKIDSLLLIPSMDSEDIKLLEENNISTRKELSSLESSIEGMSEESFKIYKTEANVQIKSTPYEVFEHSTENPKGLLNLPLIKEDDLFINLKVSDSYDKNDLFYSFSLFSKKEGTNLTLCMRKEYERGYIYKFFKKLKEHTGNVYYYGSSVLDSLKQATASQGIFLETLESLIFNKRLIDLQLITAQSIAIPYYNYSLDNVMKVLDNKSVFEDNFSLIFNFYFHANKEEKEKLNIKLLEQDKAYFDNLVKLGIFLNTIQNEKDLHYFTPEMRFELEVQDENEDKYEKESFEYNFNVDKYNLASPEDKIGTLLKQLINFHKNEKRPKELELRDLLNQTEVKLEKSQRALSFLRYRRTPDLEKPYIREYSYYKNQEFKISEGNDVVIFQKPDIQGKVKSLSKEDGLITLQFSQKNLERIVKFNKLTIIENNKIRTLNLEKAVREAAVSFDKNKDYLGLNKCLYDFLYKNFPDINNVRKGDNLYSLEEDLIDATIRTIRNMNGTTLIVQGPPGAGKTYTIRKIIYDLILEGKKIAISSNSHKAINNVINELTKDNPAINTVKMGGDSEGLFEGIKHITSFKNLKDDYNIFGGTAFSLCNPELKDKFDYLFIDEAGQVSIPNLIAMSQCTKNIVLIGDQMQLEQPLQAIHPGDSGKSALEYYLGDKKTIPQNIGFFLPITRRMNSELTKVVSDNFYEGKLKSHEESDDREIIIKDTNELLKKGKGLIYIPTSHKYNKQYSVEEINVIKKIREELIGSEFIYKGEHKIITERDIIYVSPYNMQVKKIKEKLGEDLNAGSVDLFQGQEAPIVIISLASSESNSRGLEFLLSENRLNVALSRGQALAILIGNTEILSSSVKNIKELKLLNLFSKLIKQ